MRPLDDLSRTHARLLLRPPKALADTRPTRPTSTPSRIAPPLTAVHLRHRSQGRPGYVRLRIRPQAASRSPRRSPSPLPSLPLPRRRNLTPITHPPLHPHPSYSRSPMCSLARYDHAAKEAGMVNVINSGKSSIGAQLRELDQPKQVVVRAQDGNGLEHRQLSVHCPLATADFPAMNSMLGASPSLSRIPLAGT